MTEDPRLFDGFGDPTPKRKKRKVEHGEVRVNPPWVLMTSARDIPRAHILVDGAKPTPEGAWPALCGRKALTLVLERPAVAPRCEDCSRISGRSQ